MTSATEKILQEILGHLYHGHRALTMMKSQQFVMSRVLLVQVRENAQRLIFQIEKVLKELDSELKVK